MSNLNGSNTVSPEGSARNETMNDVIGNKEDGHSDTSLYGRGKRLDEHIHGAANVYPTGANGVTVASAAGSWTLGGFVEIVPINTIAEDFDIHYISIEDLDDNTTYELVLYAGEVEIGRNRFVKNAVQDGTVNAPFMTKLQPANTQIQAKLMTASGNSEAVISLFYHTY